MFAIRKLAVREGNVPEGVIVQARSLLDTGRVANPTRMALVQREKLGMGKGQSTGVEDVRKILKRTAFDKIIGRR
ncbi:MAG: hypothetical protein ACE5G7_06940 [Candidatus Hydrothermarchaeaceae archaeon]